MVKNPLKIHCKVRRSICNVTFNFKFHSNRTIIRDIDSNRIPSRVTSSNRRQVYRGIREGEREGPLIRAVRCCGLEKRQCNMVDRLDRSQNFSPRTNFSPSRLYFCYFERIFVKTLEEIEPSELCFE